MPAPESLKLTITRRLKAPPETIFDAWLDPAMAGQWLFATPGGRLLRAEIDPSIGGEFCFREQRDDEIIEHLGEYTDLARPNRLAFEFTVNRVPEVTRVTVDIAVAGTGSELTLTHEMSPRWADFTERTKQGWEMILDGLEKVV